MFPNSFRIKVTRFARSFRQNPRYIRKRVFKDFDDERFKEKLAETGLEEILEVNDVNEATKLFIGKIILGNNEIRNAHSPRC